MRQLCHVVRRLFSCAPPSAAAAAAAATAPAPGLPQTASAAFCSSAADSVVDCVVVGAGVIGLACARAAALAGLEVVVLEAEGAWGTGTSSRNSEVVHAGIYYPTGSLKARLCVEGKQRLYEFCRAKGIPHRQLGKLIVATDERQLPKLRQLQALAAANGVCDLQLLSGRDARELEPALAASAGMLSPSSGILDSHSYMAALLADATAAGALLATHSRALGARQVPGTFPSCSTNPSSETGGAGGAADSPGSSRGHVPRRLLQLDVQDASSGEVSRLAARWLVNAAGLAAPALASAVAGLSSTHIPRQHLAKGSYFSLAGPGAAAAPFSRLVYPLPVEGGLGVHLTLDLAGAGRFGPDVQWVGAVDYSVEAGRAAAFYPEIRRYWPGLPDGSLQPSYCGIRPKLSGPGQPAADFWVAGPAAHGVPGLVNLFGMESPGLTASLALAEEVLRLLLPPAGTTAR